MSLRSKLLFICFAIFVAIIAILNYYDKVVIHDFTVYDYVSCDPSENSCFVYCEDECDYDEPYAKIEKRGRYIDPCNPLTDECEELACLSGESLCEVIYCTEDGLESGEVCNDVSVI